jgi:hypothetical protein
MTGLFPHFRRRYNRLLHDMLVGAIAVNAAGRGASLGTRHAVI